MTTKTKIKTLKFKVPIMVKMDGEAFYAKSPVLPGLLVGGDTREEALQNARDGATALLHSMIRDGDAIPLSVIVSNTNVKSITSLKNKKYFHEEIKVDIE
jgi:predicted RNase H-like HicB family nuclease